MTQDTPAPPTATEPAPLSAEEILRRTDNLVALIKHKGCGELAIRAALTLTDAREGGHVMNAVRALSPDLQRDVAVQSRLDLDGNGLESHELTAAVLAAATLAAKHNIKTTDVPIDEAFIAIAREKCIEIQKGSDGVCR